MVFPGNFEDKVEFSIVKELLKKECLSGPGRKRVEDIQCSSSLGTVQKRLDQTEEFREILASDRSFPDQDYIDMMPELLRVRLPGTFMDTEALSDLSISLNTITACVTFFKDPERPYPRLSELADNIYIDPSILKSIDRIIDQKANIRNSASPKLNEIRKDIVRKATRNEKMIGQLLALAKSSGWTAGDANITIRQGRLVIPVQAASKRKMSGFIHDESASGNTVFIEPAENFEMNNEIRELENAERREIIRILTEFTDQLRPSIDSLIEAYEFLSLMDFIRAKARFALRINGEKPSLENKPGIHWNKAVHPLLYLNHQARGKKVVSLDISLTPQQRILIISGPNAGGKSVCLKTVGLLQYMLQSGLLIPVGKNSVSGLFGQFYIEIGDEQSIDNDLSTYSSHLINIKYFLDHAHDGTLFLIDEFGAGTDPQLGGAIAEAILEGLTQTKAQGLITTHYSNLKLLADKYESIQNGAMLFDTEKMQPLFKLKTGQPGSSFTFEIARKIGFSANILDKAAKKTGKTHLDFEKQLQQLEIEREHLDKQQKEFEVADEFLIELTGKYKKQLEELERSRKEIMQKAFMEAEAIIRDSNRLVEHTIKEIKETDADKEKTRKVRQKLEQKQRALHKEIIKQRPERKKDTAKTTSLKAGDWVTLEDHALPGFITKIKGENVVVRINEVNISTSKEKLIPAEEPDNMLLPKNKTHSNVMHSIHEKAANFKLRIDVRGKTAEEALNILKKYLDNAILLSMGEVSVIHGKGDGILRKVIREYLSSEEGIKHFDDEHIERGGSGITKIYLK